MRVAKRMGGTLFGSYGYRSITLWDVILEGRQDSWEGFNIEHEV